MGLPRGRRTKSSKLQRASHFGLGKKQLAVCPKCKKPVLPHCACSFCGTYAGKEVLKIKLKKGKEGKKKKKEEKKK